MHIRTKISLNFLLMSLLLAGVGTVYFWGARLIRHQFESMAAGSLPAVESLNQARESLWGLWDLREDEAGVEAGFRKLEALLLEYASHSPLPEARDHLIKLRRGLLQARELFPPVDAAEFTTAVTPLSLTISEVIAAESADLAGRGTAVRQWSRWVSRFSLLMVFAAVLGCLLPGEWLARTIGRSLQGVREAADRVAAGDLGQRLSEESGDELAELAAAFNRMVDTIREADLEITREVEDRIRAERRAQIAAKAKSDFLAHMSHEFRTPLNGILGYTQMLSMDRGLSERNREVVTSLRKSGENLLELVNDVLDLTKIEARKMNIQKSRFYLGDFLDSLVESYAEGVRRKGLEFRVNVHESLPEDLLADPLRLRQILVNLLGNALKFTDHGHIGIAVTPVDGGVRFAVFDSGIGIDPADHETILQPFQQVEHADRRNEGTGLGLPISNHLLKVMDSGLHIRSAKGKGSTFWFDLPQPDLRHRKLVHAPTRIRGYSGPKRKLILGEEGLTTSTLLIPLLQKVGFEALHLRQTEGFVEKCLLYRPDFVMLALYFGEEDGTAIYEQLLSAYDREGGSPPPLVLFSDHRQPSDRERSLRTGAAGFMGTPIRFADLLGVLRQELNLNWTETEEDPPSESPELAREPVPERCPEPAVLDRICELAEIGNVRHLRDYLGEVKAAEAGLTAFCDHMLDLCAHYRINAILHEIGRLRTPAEERSHES